MSYVQSDKRETHLPVILSEKELQQVRGGGTCCIDVETMKVSYNETAKNLTGLWDGDRKS